MGALARHFSWHGRTSRAEYRRWLWAIIPIETVILVMTSLYGENGTIHFPTSPVGLVLFVLCFAFVISVLLITARRFRSAGLSRGWLVPTIFSINIPVGAYYWNVSATVMLLAIFAGTAVPDVPESQRTY